MSLSLPVLASLIAWIAEPVRRMRRRGGAHHIDIRVARPQDAAGMQRYVDGLSSTSRRMRFHGGVARCSEAWARRLVAQDGRCVASFVAVDAAGQIVGEARWARCEEQAGHAEFAISVADACRGRGVADALLARTVASSAAAGFEHLYGDVLAANERMQAFMVRHGFSWASAIDAGFRYARPLRAGAQAPAAFTPAWEPNFI